MHRNIADKAMGTFLTLLKFRHIYFLGNFSSDLSKLNFLKGK